LFCHAFLDYELFDNQREDVVEEAKEKGHKKRHNDHYDSEGDRLVSGRPSHMVQFEPSFFEVVGEV